jgi:pimeloyl-ACP methyl ester carboxylesterase
MASAMPPLQHDDAGDGLAIVLLHGFPHDRSLWAQQRASLSARARVIVPDLPGFGASPVSGAPPSVDAYADAVIDLLDHLGINRAVIGGLSMGGYIAMAIWRRYPDRVCGLVLCDTKATADADAAREARGAAMATIARDGVPAFAEAQLTKMVGATTHNTRPPIVDLLRAMMQRQSAAGMTWALAALRDRPDSRATLGSITVPTLVIVGDEDVLTPLADAQAMMDLLPAAANPRLEIITGAGHASCVERPAAVTLAITEFLASLPP